MAANPQTKPIDLGYEFAENWQLPSTSTIATVIITQPVSWYSFYRPTKGGRLSRPRHCSKGVQPVPKAVYRRGCRDKRNRAQCDLNLGPLTPRSDSLTTRPLLPVPSVQVHRQVKVMKQAYIAWQWRNFCFISMPAVFRRRLVGKTLIISVTVKTIKYVFW